MNKYSLNKIVANLNSKPIVIFSIWFFLIILPVISLFYYSDLLITKMEKSLAGKNKIKLVDELFDFKNQLNSASYIESTLSLFDDNNKINYESANDLNNILLEHKIKAASIIYYDSSKQFFDIYVNPVYKQEFGMYSKTMFKNILVALGSNPVDSNMLQKTTTYLQQFLMGAGPVKLQANKAIPILSGKGNLNRITAIYKPLNQVSKGIRSGFICFVCEKDIELNSIMALAASKSKNKNFKRSFCWLSSEESDIRQTSDLFSFERGNDNSLSLKSFASEEILLRNVTLNTFYPFNFENYQNKYMGLKVTATSKSMVHPLREIIEFIKLPVFLFILIISFILIRLYFFGYSFSISIYGRVVLSILSVVILPFSTFILSNFYNQYYAEEYIENEIQNYTELQINMIETAFEAFIFEKEQSISKLKNDLIKIPLMQHKSYLEDWLKHNNADLILHSINKKDILIKKNSDVIYSELAKNSKIMINIAVVKSAVDDPAIKDNEDFNQTYCINAVEVGKYLINAGKIFSTIESEYNNLYACLPVFEHETDPHPSGFVSIMFNTQSLLKEFIENNQELMAKHTIDNYSISKELFPVTEKGTVDEIAIYNSDNADSIHYINQILSSKIMKKWSLSNSINTGKYINLLSAVAVCTATRIHEFDTRQQSNILNIIIYAVIFIIVLSFLFKATIVSPVELLKKASEKVTEGDYSNRISYKSGDEFETLTTAFNDMTAALEQREKMTSYVSEEVINEVSKKDEYELAPGGERIKVSVLFCQLKGKKELGQYKPEEVTNIIGNLVDIIDKVASQNGGQIDKLIEDTLMVVFRNKKSEQNNLALMACKTALESREELLKVLPEFKIKMGIASGEAVSGKIGSMNGKLDYTVIGNPVNLAARLKVQAEKGKATGILLCPNSIRLLKGKGRLQYLERVSIKGRTNRTFPLYELLSLRS